MSKPMREGDYGETVVTEDGQWWGWICTGQIWIPLSDPVESKEER